MFRHFLLLTLIDRFKGERSISAVFHLLKGKQTSQTIQDGFTYNVHPFFKGLPTITREELEKDYLLFKGQNWIHESQLLKANPCELTDRGRSELDRLGQLYQLPEGLNGWRVGATGETFWLKLALTIQSLSHLLHEVKHYITITNQPFVLNWVKAFLIDIPIPRNQLVFILHQELRGLIGSLPSLQQTLLVHRLSGYNKEGITFDQLAYYLEKEKEELLINMKAAVESCVTNIQANLQDYPLLSKFIEEHSPLARMTQTSQETMKWFKKGLSVEAIAKIRGLKESTIQDHFVEIARIFPEPVKALCLPEETENAIQSVLDFNPTRRLSELKQMLPGEVSYFQIRLALVFREVGA